MTPEVLVFSHSVSSRLQYIIDFLSLYYGLPFKLIFDEERYVNSTSPVKINYSYHRIHQDEIFIHSHVLLFETTVRHVKIDCFEQKHYKAFFKTEGETGFDLFAGIFYLISRYEEYLPHQKDNYGRYAHQNSTAFKEGFLNLPLINIWLEDFSDILIEKDENFRHNTNRFSFLPTYDIDMAWVYRNKGFKRNAGAILLLLLKLKFARAIYRYRVVKRKTQDPYDAYSWMDELHKSTATRPVYFFLMAKQQSRYDRNINIDNSEFVSLVEDISSKYTVGLHPSWQSGDDHSLIKKEKTDLEKITGQLVQDSRQHFIRFDLPSSFRQLISAGLVNDYSMGLVFSIPKDAFSK